MKKTIVAKGRIFNFTKIEVKPGLMFDMVDHPGAVVILPVKDDMTVVMIKQYRPLIEQVMISCPAGCIEPGEMPIITAARELKEETGYTARKMIPMTFHYSSCGMTNERVEMFLAFGLTPGEQELEPTESIEVIEMTFDKALKMVQDHEITQSHDITALLYAQQFCRGRDFDRK